MKINVQMSPAADVERPVQVWLVDDNNRLRSLIAETLEREGSIRCARQFDSPNGLLSTLASRTGPDVILLDIQMGELNGLDALPAIKSLSRETRVFMLTTCFDPTWHKQAMESGASGYHIKSDCMDKLVESIRDRTASEVPIRRRRRRSSCQTAPLIAPGAATGNSKKSKWLGWFRRFASN